MSASPRSIATSPASKTSSASSRAWRSARARRLPPKGRMPTSPPSDHDRHFMAVALRLAERGLGSVWPNPAVGCVLVRDGRIVGRGWTQPGARPHGEVEALRRAGDAALGATAYVSLEPCAHYGETPPCTMALLHAGLRRVVIAATDPDPRVDGRGTALVDDPSLTCRLPDLEARSPVRVVLDGRLRLPARSQLARTARTTPFWLVTRRPASEERARRLRRLGVEVIETG